MKAIASARVASLRREDAADRRGHRTGTGPLGAAHRHAEMLRLVVGSAKRSISSPQVGGSQPPRSAIDVRMSEPLPIDAREHFSELVESVTTKRERVTVRTPSGEEVVLMNADDLESLEATLEILSDPEARASLERSRSESEAAAGLDDPLN